MVKNDNHKTLITTLIIIIKPTLPSLSLSKTSFLHLPHPWINY